MVAATRLDTTYLVETPEGVDLCQELAGPLPRLYAYLIDLALRGLILLLVGLMSLWPGVGVLFNKGVFLIIFFVTSWFYPILFETYRQGQTPGKRLFGLRVVSDDLTPVALGRSMIRNLLRVVDMLPSFYMFGLVSVVASRHFQRIGDLAAGTLVVYCELKQPTQKQSLPTVKPRPPGCALSDDERLALMAFTERHQSLSIARQAELASRLKGLTGELDDSRAVKRLQSIGLWLLGIR